MNRHSRAAGSASIDSSGNRRAISLALVSLAALLALVFASSASALTQRPFKETFGSAAQPDLYGGIVAVDRQNNDVLIGKASAQSEEVGGTLTRFHADGTPAPFSALGTNVIDGREANGKPCAEEPASCDATPREGLGFWNEARGQIAIDESGGPTDGTIYVTGEAYNPYDAWIDIFAPDGTYLGELTGPNDEERFGEVVGLAVDQTGALYVSAASTEAGSYIEKYVPSANPVVNTDGVLTLKPPSGDGPKNIALGAGPSAGSLFAIGGRSDGSEQRAYKFDLNSGQSTATFAGGQVGFGAIAVDPNTGTVLLKGRGKEIVEYDASTSKPVKVGRILGSKDPGGFAVNSASEVIVGGLGETGEASAVFGTPAIVPTVTVDSAQEVTGTKAVVSGTVNPSGLPVTECFVEYGESGEGSKAPCVESPATIGAGNSPVPVHANLSGLKPNGRTYNFRLVATNGNGREESEQKTLTTLNSAVTEAANAISGAAATLNGTIRPEGEAYSACYFEYGINTSAGFEKKVPCVPGATELPQTFSPQPVRASITGLQAATTYRFRLVATSSALGAVEGEELTFTTHGSPQITDVRALNADQSSVTLEGKVNPSGFGTSYRIEWGPTSAYGHRVPAEFEPFVGTGETPVRVSAQLAGLSAGASYHYRIVASSEAGMIASTDRTFETLNSCGLPEGRCFELVSRREPGPVAIPGEYFGSSELHYQAAPGGGALAYPAESGYPDATRGGEVLYRSERNSEGWQSKQLSVPLVAPNQHDDGESTPGPMKWLSNDLSCGFAESFQPLTSDPRVQSVFEEGGANLYRANPDGSWSLVTNVAPQNSREIDLNGAWGLVYGVGGASQSCGKLVFSTALRYPGIEAPAGLYEWDRGTLRSLAIIPAPGGEEVPVPEARFGSGSDRQNAISEDGSRVFFSARREASPNPEEIFRDAVFVREDGAVTRDLTLSQTATPDTGATYQWATADGSQMFFTANAGLTTEASGEGKPEGTDLYEYDLETEELTDRTVAQVKGGAQVAGFLGGSEDGSVVYFASPAQLLPGRGPTLGQNKKANSYSIYRESGGEFDFVGTVDAKADETQKVFIQESGDWTSQTSADGRYLLFQSSLNVTGYAGGRAEAYLYDAEGGSPGPVCVSCRQDGLPSLASTDYQVLPRAGFIKNDAHAPRFLVDREGEPRVFFSSPNALASDAVAGQNNIYEWVHGQVFRLAGAPEGTQEVAFGGSYATFAGASADGGDVYFASPETLNWEDGDEGRVSVYDARIGGGLTEPQAPPTPCVATTEGACQGAPKGGPSVPGAASTTFTGPGNEKQTQAKKKKKKAHKKKSKPVKKKKKGSGKKARHANGNGRTGK